MQPQEHTALQEVTTHRRGPTTLHLGITMLLQEATTPRQDMTRLEATVHREHMIHLELTQQRQTTPHPHRMSRHPHTGNPRPSVTITLTTRQNPLTDSPTPPQHTPYTLPMCVLTYMYLHEGQFKRKLGTGSQVVFECALHLKHRFSHYRPVSKKIFKHVEIIRQYWSAFKVSC